MFTCSSKVYEEKASESDLHNKSVKKKEKKKSWCIISSNIIQLNTNVQY